MRGWGEVVGQLRRDEGGFTLVELLASIAVGTVVLFAIFGLLDYTVTAQHKVEDRVDAVQRGRNAMETITQQLRSQICLGPGYPAITAGDPNSVTFYTDLGGDTPKLQRRTLAFDSVTGTVTETDWDMSGTIPTNPTFTLARTINLATNLVGVSNTNFFRYYGFTPDPVVPNKLLGSTLSDSEKAQVVKIGVSFVSRPTRGGNLTNQVPTTFQNDVYVRTSDPSDPEHSPQCI
jgi:type II secretory pathway pseudopilin PulG